MTYFKVLTAALSFAHSVNAAIPQFPGFTLTWSDDFVGTAKSLPDPANWIVTTGTSYPGGAPNVSQHLVPGRCWSCHI